MGEDNLQDDDRDPVLESGSAVEEATDASVADEVMTEGSHQDPADVRPLFERNAFGVMRLTSVAAAYQIQSLDEPTLAFINDEPVVLIPAGFLLMMHPDPHASCTVGGVTYNASADGPLLVPAAVINDLKGFGFEPQ